MEVEFEWEQLLVVALVFYDFKLESVSVHFCKVLLIEDFPVNLKRTDACVFDLEGLSDLAGVCNNRRHRQRWGNCVIIQTNLVRRDHNRASGDVDADWELDRREALDVADNVVIKLAANVVVDRNRDRHLCISRQLRFMGREDQSDSLIVA